MTIKEMVAEAKKKLKEKIAGFAAAPSLAIIQVGNVEASNRYIKNKIKDCEEVGIVAVHYNFPEHITEEHLKRVISNLKEDGIIVQLPLPGHIDPHNVATAIPKEKDVDGFREDSKFTPCTPGGILWYLNSINFPISGCNAVVIGRSDIVGKPMAKLLTDANATVTLCHSRTSEGDLNYYLAHADLVVCAVGKAGFLDPRLAPWATIIDVGINFIPSEDGTKMKLVGDVLASNETKNRVTPVPGGVGLLTRLALLNNVVEAAYGDD